MTIRSTIYNKGISKAAKSKVTKALNSVATLLIILITLGAGFLITYKLNLVFAVQNPSADLDQYANLDGTWVNGNLGTSKATYYEGDSVPYRIKLDNLNTSISHTITIQWDTTKSGKHALDYLTTYNRSVSSNPCDGVSGCSSSTTFSIPADTQVTGAGVTPIPGVFTLFGGTITAASVYSYPNGTGFTGDKSARITLTFTTTVTNPVLAWGGHIADRADWGADNAAVSIPGSPYHTSLVDLDGAGGSQDRSLSTEAVIFPASITIIKQANPEGSTSFPFTASPSPLTSFNLVDNGTSTNTKVFSHITDFQTYSINETPIPAGWGFDSISCSVTSPNGGSQKVSGSTTTIDLKEGENVTCTYLDSIRAGTLTVIKHVINDNGGTKTAADFTLHVTSGGVDVVGSPAAGSEPGTSYTLTGGSYVVSEDTPPTGYTQTGFSGDCNSSGNVTVVAGETKTCTINNNDNLPALHLIKTITNDNGGTAVVTDWTLTATGTGITPTNLSGTTQVNSGANFKADTYTLGENGGPAGYTASSWSCVGGTQDGNKITVALGQSATCTINNNDNLPALHLIKTITNDNGGTAVVTDWTLTATGTGITPTNLSGTTQVNSGANFKADTYTLGENGGPAGYTASSWSCVGGTQDGNKITVALGQSATCTINNDDQFGRIIIDKVTDPSENSQSFSFNLTGGPSSLNQSFDLADTTTPYDSGIVLPGLGYSVSETVPGGWDQTSATCDNGSLVSNIDVAPGETVTCTFTNRQLSTGLILDKSNSTEGSFVNPGMDVVYTIVITNSGEDTIFSPIDVLDILPEGFTYKEDSATVDGVPSEPTVTYVGTVYWLTWSIGELELAPLDSVTIMYTATVGLTVPAGTYDNTTVASGKNRYEETVDSNKDTSRVEVKVPAVLSETTETPAVLPMTNEGKGPDLPIWPLLLITAGSVLKLTEKIGRRYLTA